VENCGGLQVRQFVGWVVLPRACRCLWGCERILGKDGRHSLVLLNLRWGMRVGQNFGIICGAGIWY
jgi:hypothetical protein